MSIGINNGGNPALTKLNEITLFDAKSFMCHRGANYLFGQGTVFNSKVPAVKKFIDEVNKLNRLDGLMLQIAYETLYHGGVVMTINRTKTGKFLFSFATPELLQNVSQIEITPFYARLMLRKVVGLKTFIVNETWTTTEVKRNIVIGENNTTREFDSSKDEMPQDLVLPAYEKHNLGFIPFVYITAKENRNALHTGITGWDKMSIDYPVRFMADSINFGLRQQFKEKWKGATRVFGDVEASYAQKLVDDGTISQFVADDYVITVDRTQNQSKPIEVSPATYDAMKWVQGWQAEIDLYAIGCGYSPIFGAQTQQTEAETLLSKDADQRTTKQLRRRFTEILKELYAKLIVYEGLAGDLEGAYELFSLEIKENVVYNQLQLIDFLNNAIQYGLMTQEEAVMLMRDLDNVEDAEKIVAEINEKLLERQKATMEVYNQNNGQDTPGQGNGGGQGAMGQGGDADPNADKQQ